MHILIADADSALVAGVRSALERAGLKAEVRVVRSAADLPASLTAVRPGIVRRVRRQARLLREHRELLDQIRILSGLLDVAPASISVHDPQGRFLYANQHSFDLHGYTREEFMALNLHELDVPESARLIEPRIRELQETGRATFEVEHLRKDRSTVPLQVHTCMMKWQREDVLLSVALDITARRHVEQALRESEERFRSLVESSPMGFHMYRLERDGRLVFVGANPAADRILGIDHRQLVGRSLEEAFPPLTATEIPGRYRHVAAGGEAWETSLVDYRDEQISGAFEVHAFHTGPGCMAAMFIDTKDRLIAQEKLRLSEEKHRKLFETMAQGVVYQDRSGAIIAANPAAQSILGLTLDEMTGRTSMDPCWEAISADGGPLPGDRHPAMISLATARPAQGLVGVRRAADGRQRWIQVSAQPQFRPGEAEPFQVFATFTDITELKLAQEEVRRLNAELEERVRARTVELEEAVRELEAFSYSVSHDLRAPLRAMNGFAQILLEEHAPALPPEARGHLTTIRRNAARMGALIDDLLAFSRIGRSALCRSAVDSQPLVRAVLEELRAELGERRVEIRMGDLPVCDADPTLLRQVWANLLSNALKFTRRTPEAVIEIGARAEGDRVIYHVRDNGVGFDMRYADKLFGVFERLHSDAEYAGTGVGLAIVKRIIDRHGGEIRAESREGHGTVFSFSLPPAAGRAGRAR